MYKRLENKNGITLVALIITIIILLILAGISIQALTNTGLFAQANRAKKETQRAQVIEWLNLKLMEVQMYKPTGTAEEIIEATRVEVYDNAELEKMGKKVVVDENTSTQEDGEEVDVYFYVQVDEDVYKVDMKGAQFIGEEGKFPPVITLESITSTTNSITVQVSTKRNEGGTIEYYIKAEDEKGYGEPVIKAETETTYTYTGLEQNKKYNIKIVAIAANGQTAEVLVDRILGSVPDLVDADITFTYSPAQGTWTNGSVTVTASANKDITGYTLKLSTDLTTWSESVTRTENGPVYAKLSDSTNQYGDKYATGNVTNIDTTKPIVTGATATTNSIEITATDEASGIIGYAVTTSDTAPEDSTYIEVANTTSLNTTVTGKTQGTTYYVWVKDEAGNVNEIASAKTDKVTSGTETGAITFGTTTWSVGKASTTISTNTSYTIQYQVNSITGEWTTGTTVTGLVHGDQVYARLWDGTNGGAASAANNILDGTDPSASISLSATTVYTTGSITATVTHSDNQSGVKIASCKWVYNTTSSAIGTDLNSYTGGTFSSNPQTITLSSTTVGTYYLHVLTTDVAGRAKETISSAVTVIIPPDSATASTSTTHTATAITYTWDEISTIAKMISNNSAITNDTAEVKVTLNGVIKTLGIGDTATVDGNTVRILGFNHDTLTTSTAYGATTATGKAGISFEYVTFLTTAAMNSSETNSGGWGSCSLRKTLNSTTYDGLSIKDKIKQVEKVYIMTYNNASLRTTSSDYLWLLSCGEIWDNGYDGGITRGLAIATEGSQYKYYKTTLGSTSYSSTTDITKKPNSTSSEMWWTRSPMYNDSYYYVYVFGSGRCGCGNAVAWEGIAPGFSI